MYIGIDGTVYYLSVIVLINSLMKKGMALSGRYLIMPSGLGLYDFLGDFNQPCRYTKGSLRNPMIARMDSTSMTAACWGGFANWRLLVAPMQRRLAMLGWRWLSSFQLQSGCVFIIAGQDFDKSAAACFTPPDQPHAVILLLNTLYNVVGHRKTALPSTPVIAQSA